MPFYESCHGIDVVRIKLTEQKCYSDINMTIWVWISSLIFLHAVTYHIYNNISSVCNNILSVIRQKGESQNGCFKKTKLAKFSEKRTLHPDMHMYVFVSLKNSFSNPLFCLITDDILKVLYKLIYLIF